MTGTGFLEITKSFWNNELGENVHTHSVLRELAVEEKVSGTGLLH